MKTTTIHDTKINSSKNIAAAKKGEVVFAGILGADEFKLVNMPLFDPTKSGLRSFKLAKNKIKDSIDGFSDKTETLVAKLLAVGRR